MEEPAAEGIAVGTLFGVQFQQDVVVVEFWSKSRQEWPHIPSLVGEAANVELLNAA